MNLWISNDGTERGASNSPANKDSWKVSKWLIIVSAAKRLLSFKGYLASGHFKCTSNHGAPERVAVVGGLQVAHLPTGR